MPFSILPMPTINYLFNVQSNIKDKNKKDDLIFKRKKYILNIKDVFNSLNSVIILKKKESSK